MKKRGVYIDPLWLFFLMLGFVLGVLLMMTAPEMILDASAAEVQEDTITVYSAETVAEKCEVRCEYKVEQIEETAQMPEIEMEQPVEEVVAEPEAPESIGLYRITAYCSCKSCCGKDPADPWYGITATGTKATEGRTIAVDPKVIPYGSVVYFEGPDGLVGGYVAEDCGGAIKGNEIDLYFDSHAEALEWGVRELEVYAYR